MPELERPRGARDLTEEQDFLSSVSWEVQVMAEAVAKYLEVLAVDLHRPSPSLSQMHIRAKRVSTAAADLAELAVANSDERQLRREDVDLEEAVENAASAVYAEALLKEQRLVIDVDEEAREVSADPRMLRRLLISLLARAVRATPAHGTVRVSARKSNGFPLIGVADAGIPIEDEDLPRVFHPFVETHSDALKDSAASGLALALTKRLVEAHRGNIWVERSAKEGNTFFFTLK